MVASKAIKVRYDDLAAHAPALRQLVRERLEPFCEENHFGFDDRIKSLDSFAEKLETGRVQGWNGVDDFYAATVVVPSLRDEATALVALRERFQEVKVSSRASTRTPPDVFRFDSMRFIGKLKPTPERSGSPVAEMHFEVQVRTAFEHAWSTTTHALSYKSDHSDWKRLRLSAALRATVEQIDLAIAGFERTAAEVMPGSWEESDLKFAILERYKSLFSSGHLPAELRPTAWSRFVDNLFALCTCESRRRRRATLLRQGIADVVSDAIAAVERWAGTTDKALIPRSLSLFQTSFGVLCRERVLHAPLDFVAFGIEDIVALFPEAKGVASREE